VTPWRASHRAALDTLRQDQLSIQQERSDVAAHEEGWADAGL
jgi:hypothetical protein